MDTPDILQRLSVALAIGLLIGIERGWQTRSEREGERTAGLRTLGLSGLLGGLWGAIAQTGGAAAYAALGVAFATFGAAMAAYRWRENVHDGRFGATTLMAALVAFSLGALAVIGDTAAAGAMGVATAGLLALKPVLHAWVRRLSWAELRSGLLLAAMTFIMLPMLPNRTVDPWGAVNPYELWLMTVALAVISFVGYVAIKLTGDRAGSVATGIAGGLASSTAVTVTLARMAAEHPGQERHLLAGILLAGATMMVRVLVVAAAVNAVLLGRLLIPIALATGTLAAIAMVLLAVRRTNDATGAAALKLGNPFDLGTVLKLGALLTGVTVAAKVLTGAAGAAGAYALAALSGIADVDALTLSMARLGGGSIALETAARAILLVVAVNTVAKAVLGWISGGARIGRGLAMTSAAALAAGTLGLVLTG